MTDTARTSRPIVRWIMEALLVLMLLGAAFGISATYVLQSRYDPLLDRPAAGTDMATYDDIARRITKGEFLAGTGTESPLYPRVFLPLVYLVTGNDLLAVRLVQSGLHALNVLLIFLIARRLFSRPSGMAAAVLAILYIPFIVYSAALLSETLLNTTILLMILMLLDLRLRRQEAAPATSFFIAGMTIGLAAAAKPTVLIFLPFALLWVLIHAPAGILKRLSRLATCLAGLTAMLIPFVLWGYLLTGSLMPLRGNSGAMFLMGNNPSATGAYHEPSGEIGKKFKAECKDKSIAEQDRIAYRIAMDFIRSNPQAFLKLLVAKLGFFWGYGEIGNNLSVTYCRQTSFLRYPPFLSFGLLLPAAIIGAFMAIPRFRTTWLIYAFVASYSLAIALFVVVGRYRLAIAPFIVLFAGHCLATVGRWIGSGRFRAASMAVLAMAVLMIFVYSGYLWRVAYPLIEGPLVSVGFSWRTICAGPNEFLMRDDSERLSDYGVILKPGEAARKTLYVAPDILKRAEKAFVIVCCTASPDASLHIEVNGHSFDAPEAEILAVGQPEMITVPIPPAVLEEGRNEIVIAPEQGSVKIALDDSYDFNRSAVRDAKGNWRTYRLDTETCKTFRSLHIADGELMVRIRIETAKQISTP